MKLAWVTALMGVAGLLSGCGASSAETTSFGGSPRSSEATSSDGSGGGTSETTPPASPDPGGATQGQSQGGLLTAGTWDDNRNFDVFKKFLGSMEGQTKRGALNFSEAERTAARDKANAPRGPSQEADIALVLDTTGSMGDELSYLQTEFDAIAATLHEKVPQVTPRWSLVLYKDKGDTYLTRSFKFTSDTATFRTQLRAQAAGGGGDIPEAVVDGLGETEKLDWRKDASVAKMAFWVADAPAHPGQELQLTTAIRNVRDMGVHVYPVGASGVSDTAEYQMRAAAQITGGRYLFLTDDSGVGNTHKEPRIPCYQVTKLDRAIVRMVKIEVTGQYSAPEPSEVLRSVGNPKDGRCETQGGPTILY